MQKKRNTGDAKGESSEDLIEGRFESIGSAAKGVIQQREREQRQGLMNNFL